MSEYAKYSDGSETEIPLSTNINKGFILSLVFNITLGGFFFGYVMSCFNFVQTFVQGYAFDETVSDLLVTLMTSFVPLGAGVGALMTGSIARAIGRKQTSVIVDLVSLIGTILTILPHPILLLLGRLLQGLCVGANSSLVPLMINEVAPAEMSGTLGTFNQLQITIGVLVPAIIALGMPTKNLDQEKDNQYFRIVLGLAGVAPLVRLLLTLAVFKSDTPKYLVSRGRDTEAQNILSQIYGDRRAQTELVSLKRQHDLASQAGQLTMADIFGPKYRKRLLIGVAAAVLQQLSGINAIIFFSNTIFKAGGVPDDSNLPTIYTLIMDVLQVLGCVFAGLIIERLGRRALLIGGFLLLGAILGAFGILSAINPNSTFLKWLIWGYILGFGLTIGPIPWVYISDILPDVAIGIAVLGNWASAFAIGMSFKALYEATSMAFPFFLFAGSCILGAGFMTVFAKETKGKNAQEIDEVFAGKEKSDDDTINI